MWHINSIAYDVSYFSTWRFIVTVWACCYLVTANLHEKILRHLCQAVPRSTYAKWVYLTICTQSRYTYVPYCVYMRVPPRIRHGTWMYPAVYEGVHTCTPSYTLGYMYVPPRIRQGTCMYPHVYVRVHRYTQSFAAGYLTYSITGRLSWFSVSTVSDYRRSFPL